MARWYVDGFTCLACVKGCPTRPILPALSKTQSVQSLDWGVQARSLSFRQASLRCRCLVYTYMVLPFTAVPVSRLSYGSSFCANSRYTHCIVVGSSLLCQLSSHGLCLLSVLFATAAANVDLLWQLRQQILSTAYWHNFYFLFCGISDIICK